MNVAAPGGESNKNYASEEELEAEKKREREGEGERRESNLRVRRVD